MAVRERDKDVGKVCADPALVPEECKRVKSNLTYSQKRPPIGIPQLGHVELVARRPGHELVVIFEEFFKRLVIEVDELFQRQKVLPKLLGLALKHAELHTHTQKVSVSLYVGKMK